MAVNNNKITAPDSIANVQTVTPVHLTRTVSGETQTISSCNLGTLITTKQGDTVQDSAGNTWTVSNRDGDINNGSINMWAKYKPVIWTDKDGSSNGYFANDQLELVDNKWQWKPLSVLHEQAWWIADDTNHGLSVPEVIPEDNTPSKFLKALEDIAKNKIDGNLNGWRYNPPKGTIQGVTKKEPFRLTDFIGYNHDAPQPLKTSRGTTEISGSQETEWSCSYSVMEPVPRNYDDRDYIIPTDLRLNGTTYYTVYPGMAIFKMENGEYKALAWTKGTEWKGLGVWNSDIPQDLFIYEYTVEARFKKDQTYYILPIYVTKEDVTQPKGPNDELLLNYSSVGTSGCRLIPVPYTTFMQFTAIQRQTDENIAYPYIDKHIMPATGIYSTTVTISSKTPGYNGTVSSTTPFRVDIYFALSTWDEDPAILPEGVVKEHRYKEYVGFQDDTEDTFNFSVRGIDPSKMWKVVFFLNGQKVTYALMSQDDPFAPAQI